jgi:transporter family-2 protein
MAGTVQRLGILRSGLASVAGLLAGALVLDLVAPTPGGGLTLGIIVGVVLAFVAVAVSLVRR